MSETKEKYKVVYAPRTPKYKRAPPISPTPTTDKITWGAQLSALYDTGYEIYSVRDEFIVMRLREDNKYENINELIDVKPDEVNGYLQLGYTVTESWAKNVRMVKR